MGEEYEAAKGIYDGWTYKYGEEKPVSLYYV